MSFSLYILSLVLAFVGPMPSLKALLTFGRDFSLASLLEDELLGEVGYKRHPEIICLD